MVAEPDISMITLRAEALSFPRWMLSTLVTVDGCS